MANKEHLALLRQGVMAWNEWRITNPGIQPDLTGANLSNAHLTEADLSGADLKGANLSNAHLTEADLSKAFLSRADLARAYFTRALLREADLTGATLFMARFGGADLTKANLYSANLTRADLTRADLSRATLTNATLLGATLTNATLTGADLLAAHLAETDLRQANLDKANLIGAALMRANLEGATLTGCQVYGVSVWDVNLDRAQQSDLVITYGDEPVITVDNLEVAQFIHLLLHNEKLREVIDTITSKAVLVLGRFTPERKTVLDAMREELRRQNYLPIVFDFEKPASRDLTETISTLAHMARFVIADITDAKSIPQELERIVPGLPSVPVQPLLHILANEYGMFEHFKRYPWVLETYQYESIEEVIASLPEKVIAPAEVKAKELLRSMKR